jgi:hypothetical protein
MAMPTSHVLALRPFVKVFKRGLATMKKQTITYVESSHAPSTWNPKSAVVYPNIITEDDEKLLLGLINQRFKRCVWDVILYDFVCAHQYVTLTKAVSVDVATKTATGTQRSRSIAKWNSSKKKMI